MTIPANIVRCNFHYGLGNAEQEEANWGFHLEYVRDVPEGLVPAIEWQPALDALAGDLSDPQGVLWATIQDRFPLDVQPLSVRVAHLSPDRTEDQAASTGLSGEGGTASPPM